MGWGMTERHLKLKRLVELAGEPCGVRRRTLLCEVTDLFLAESESLTERQNWELGEIMAQLAYDLDRQVRAELANRLAAEGDAPRALIRRLAHDDIAIARPVLRQSPVLTQDDLLEVARTQSQEHLQAIAARSDTEAELSDALAILGDDTVVVDLLRNERAVIGDDTMARIAGRADRTETIQRAIVDRSDVPREIIESLLDRVSKDVRHLILERFPDVGSRQLDAVVAEMKRKMDGEPPCRAEQAVADLARRKLLDDRALSRFIADARPMEFLVGLARLMRMDVETVRRALAEKTGTPLAILCRAGGIGHGLFKQTAFSNLSCMPSDPNHVLPLVKLYLRLDRDAAERIVRFWRSRKLAVEQLGQALGTTGNA